MSVIVEPELIVIGTSRGGFRALQIILQGIPEDFCTPIAVVQHRHRTSNEVLGNFLERYASIPVRDVEDKQPIERGTVYLAPANYHMLVDYGIFSLSTEGPVRYSRPSVDVLFETAAEAYADKLIGIVLTGANDDGAAGARRVKELGGMVIVQDPSTAESPEMPRAVIAATEVDHILRLEEISPFLVNRCAPAIR